MRNTIALVALVCTVRAYRLQPSSRARSRSTRLHLAPPPPRPPRSERGWALPTALRLRERQVPLGQCADLKSVPLGIGTWSWGNRLLWGYEPNEETDAVLERSFVEALDGGLTLFDTADSYGTGDLEGRAEELLGQFRAKSAKRSRARAERLVVATKLAPYPWRLTRGNFADACAASKKRLGADVPLELAQAHWSPSNYAPWQEKPLLNGLADCYDAGLVRGVGLSNYGPVKLREANALFQDRSVPVALNQVQFSLLSTEPLTSGLVGTCAELNITPVAYSPLALGLLSGRYSPDRLNEVPRGPRGVLFRQLLPQLRPLLNTMEEMGAQRGKTVAQLALNWCICKGATPIVGAKTPAMVREAVGALGWRLSSAEVGELELQAARCKPATKNIFQTR